MTKRCLAVLLGAAVAVGCGSKEVAYEPEELTPEQARANQGMADQVQQIQNVQQQEMDRMREQMQAQIRQMQQNGQAQK